MEATQAALGKAGVRVEGDGLSNDGREGIYPEAMFDFKERRSVCISAMKRAFSIGLRGNDEAVKDGTWSELFEKAGETEMEGMEGSDDEGEYADDADHQSHHTLKGRKGGKHTRSKSSAVKEGPMDRHVKKVKT